MEQHLQRLAVVAPAPAGLAAHVHVGEEVHADRAHAVALAGLAAPAFHVEGEPAGLVAAGARFRHQREQVADEGEGAGIGGGIGARRAADRALVDGDDLVDGLGAFERLVATGLGGGTVEPSGQGAVQDVFHQRRLARAAHARHRGEHAERDLDVDIAQVVLAGTLDAEQPLRRAPDGGNRNGKLAAKVAPGQAPVDRGRRALIHQAAALPPRAFAEVEDPVRGPDRLLVVLDDHDRVAEVADAGQGGQQALVVALVQADGRLVEDVQDPLHAAADLAGQADAMGFTAGEGRGRPIEGQISHPHGVEEAQARQDLGEQPLRDRLLALLEDQRGEGPDRFRHRKADEFRDRALAQAHGQALRPQAGPAAFGTRRLHQVRSNVLEGVRAVRGRGHLVGGGRLQPQEGLGPAAQVGEHARKRAVTLEQGLTGAAGQLGERDFEREPETLGQLLQRFAHEAGSVPLPGMDGAVHEGLVLVGDDAAHVHVPARAQTLAPRAGAVGAVEGEGARAQLREGDVAHRARQPPAVEPLLLADGHHDHVPGQVQSLVQREDQPLLRARPEGEPIDEHLDPVVAAGIERDTLLEADHAPVHAHAQVPLGGECGELLAEGSFTAAHHRGQHGDRGSGGQPPEPFRNLLRRLRGHRPLALRAVRAPEGREEDAQVVVDLGDGADGRPRMADRRPLLDRDGRAEPGHGLHVRLLHLVQELAGVGGEALHVAPLALGVEGIESQAALAGPRGPGDDHQPVAGDIAVHTLQVVDSRAADRDRLVPRRLQPGSC